MKKLLAGTLLLLSLSACSDRTPHVIAMPQTQADVRPGVMTVTGTATLEVSPDCADLTMTLSSDGARPSIVTAALARKQQAVIDAMKKLGLGPSQLKISHITLNPVYENWPHVKVTSFRSELTITATTKDFGQIAAMMEAGTSAGATSISSQFRRSDLPALKRQVREMALEAAKEKAKLTASTLGITLGRVTSVAEAPAGMMWQSHYFPNSVANAAAQAPAAQPTTALGGALQPLTLDITIGFELGDSA